MTWHPLPHQPLYPLMEEMKELLNIPNTFQTPLPSKQHIYTGWSGKPWNSVEEPKKQSMTSTKESEPWKGEERRSMDDLWRSVPSRKTSKLGSGKSTKPYSWNTQTTREKPRLSQRLGLPPLPKKKSLAERLGVHPSSTPSTPILPVENPPHQKGIQCPGLGHPSCSGFNPHPCSSTSRPQIKQP
jgi:hypothetical protein